MFLFPKRNYMHTILHTYCRGCEFRCEQDEYIESEKDIQVQSSMLFLRAIINKLTNFLICCHRSSDIFVAVLITITSK